LHGVTFLELLSNELHGVTFLELLSNELHGVTFLELLSNELHKSIYKRGKKKPAAPRQGGSAGNTRGPNIEIQGSQQIRKYEIRIVFMYLFVFANTRPRIAVLQNYAAQRIETM
jgi:hypothetical protein